MAVLLMLLLLEPKKKRFVPSPDRSVLQSTEDSCRVSGADMLIKKMLKGGTVPVRFVGLIDQNGTAEAEARVGDPAEVE
jgi:hypothetical protein